MSSIDEEVFRETTKVVHAFITQLYEQNLISMDEAFQLTDVANDVLIEETHKYYAQKEAGVEPTAGGDSATNEMPRFLVDILQQFPNNADGLLGQLKYDAEKGDKTIEPHDEGEKKKRL